MARRKWYGARVLLKITNGDRLLDGTLLPRIAYEDRLIVVRASSEEEAWVKAEDLTRRSEEPFADERGRRVRWSFDRVLACYEMVDDKLTEGTEVFSSFIGADVARILRRKAEPGPWPAYKLAHPGADPGKVKVREVIDWWVTHHRKRSRVKASLKRTTPARSGPRRARSA